jgi:hypothetical protein
MCADANESLRIFLTQQLGDVEEDIETISSYYPAIRLKPQANS